MNRQKLATAAVTLIALLGINVALESPAAAACTPNDIVLQTYKSGNWIDGRASMPTCGDASRSSTLTLQRSRWYGWEDLGYGTVYGDGYWYYVSYNCAGTGTHEFRTIATGGTVGGVGYVRESNHITVTC
ncbi:hypothetical protein F4553_000017 [Allocatelliglobosispora scoriae]|uniref:Uncharacterized protein n=1 Tax=Allocatelliglobosispora scoriae TaxID=643052 RepID=A0A841BH55_9ACTN|nr:hypothetical protein [Allocatelliglobosispora scoriae]MBB5866638.1 hypothetical protein [Allocatelliglobosispora scoriae]